ncbi:hypothetical protein BJ165DRAFT_1500504 [Panaeolus papilionaceus]|nr:hypothetical protein BJ165DRAFT_1500504 [Panaeolus papilionaceus]
MRIISDERFGLFGNHIWFGILVLIAVFTLGHTSLFVTHQNTTHCALFVLYSFIYSFHTLIYGTIRSQCKMAWGR